jgi:hypothetical protein
LYLLVRWVMLLLVGAALTAGVAAFEVRHRFGRKIY